MPTLSFYTVQYPCLKSLQASCLSHKMFFPEDAMQCTHQACCSLLFVREKEQWFQLWHTNKLEYEEDCRIPSHHSAQCGLLQNFLHPLHSLIHVYCQQLQLCCRHHHHCPQVLWLERKLENALTSRIRLVSQVCNGTAYVPSHLLITSGSKRYKRERARTSSCPSGEDVRDMDIVFPFTILMCLHISGASFLVDLSSPIASEMAQEKQTSKHRDSRSPKS